MFDRVGVFRRTGGAVGTDDLLTLDPGRVVGLTGRDGAGLTRLGLALLREPARRGLVAFLDARGWLCPVAAWEAGIPPERLVVVRCPDRARWAQVAAALCEGVRAVYAEVPAGVKDPLLRRLGALARARSTALALRPLGVDLPPGLAHLRLEPEKVTWTGPDAGHGRLAVRRITVGISGKAVGGRRRLVEVEDDGTDTLRVVPRLAAAAVGAAAG